MLGPIKNRKEINKSINKTLSTLQEENLNKKEKLNKIKKINTLKKIVNRNIKPNFYKTSFITQQISYKTKNNSINSINNNSINKNEKTVKFFGIQNNTNILNKKNILKPINQKLLHKTNSTPQLIRNDNNTNNIININKNNNKDNIVNPRQTKQTYTYKTINNSRNKKLEELKKKLNNSYNSFNMGFNSTKNNNTNTNYFSDGGNNFFISSYDNNTFFNQTKIPKTKKRYFSKFFYKSQSKLISSKKIFKHYIKEEEKEKIKPVKFFLRGGAPRSIKELKDMCKGDLKFEKRMKELKYNNTIAFKDDFNILEYQSTLITLLSKRISEKNLHDLQKKFVSFNEKNFGMVGPKGRFTNMAEKIKYNIPLYLYEKIKQLDIDKLISKYNYYQKINQNLRKRFKKKYENKNYKKKRDVNADFSNDNLNKNNNNNNSF